MATLEEEVKLEIKNYIDNRGGVYEDWYAGVSEDPRTRLIDDHNVDEQNGLGIFLECYSATAARNVEEYLVSVLGTDGGTGGGDEDATYVYAYRKTSDTIEQT